MPTTSLITGDVRAKEDLKKYIQGSTPRDLCCGAAELFESYLENLGHSPNADTKPEVIHPINTLIINGSTVRNPSEKELLEQLSVQQLPLPGVIKGDQFLLEKTQAKHWYDIIAEALNKNHIAAITIDHPVQQNKKFTEIFLNQFVEMIRYITGSINMNDIHFCLTGGATASAIIRNLLPGVTRVKEEVVAGVVTLVITDGKNNETYCTVKPGSYAWPDSFLRELAERRN